MRIAIVGAGGRLGQALLTVALGKGHHVHALTRKGRAIRRATDNLTVFLGDVETGAGLEPFLSRCNKIVWVASCKEPLRGIENLIAALGGRHIDRLVFVSRIGVGESAEQARRSSALYDRIIPLLRARQLRRIADAEDALRRSGVPHVILRSARLVDDRPGGALITSGPAGKPPEPLSRAELARFILRVLDEPGWQQSELSVGSRRSA